MHARANYSGQTLRKCERMSQPGTALPVLLLLVHTILRNKPRGSRTIVY